MLRFTGSFYEWLVWKIVSNINSYKMFLHCIPDVIIITASAYLFVSYAWYRFEINSADN